MRFPYTINVNTRKAYDPSKEALELNLEKERRIFPERLEFQDDEVPCLVTICVRSISKFFKEKQILDELPGPERDHLLENLPTDLPLELVIPLINDEFYWKRRFDDQYGVVMERFYPNWTWKSLFVERYMREIVEQAQPQYGDEFNMDDITKLCCPYIRYLKVTQLQAWKPPLTLTPEEIPKIYPIDHINFEPILKNLTELVELDIIYGMKNVSESFNWNMFKISVLDCKNLGLAILPLQHLTVLKVHRTKMEDAHCQALMQSLVLNTTLIELDLSHCHIRDRGALCIAKVIMAHPTLEILKLCNNLIQKVGAEGIGYALLDPNCCPLDHLNLRLNPLQHDGVMGILRSVVRGTKPRELILAACMFEETTPLRICQMLKLNSTIEVLDISNNWFGKEGGELLVEALTDNFSIKLLDIRETDIPPSLRLEIRKLLFRNTGQREEEEVEEENLEEESEDEEEEEEEEWEGEEEDEGEEEEENLE